MRMPGFDSGLSFNLLKKIPNLSKLVENSFQIVTLHSKCHHTLALPKLCSWHSSQVLLPPPKTESSRLSAPPEPQSQSDLPLGKAASPTLANSRPILGEGEEPSMVGEREVHHKQGHSVLHRAGRENPDSAGV